MENRNSISQGRVSQMRMRNSRTSENVSNPISMQPLPPPKFEPVSKECADAMRSLVMTQINLGNKAEYYSPDAIYDRFRH